MQIIDRFVEWLYNKRFSDRKYEHELYEVNQIVKYSTKNVCAFYDLYNDLYSETYDKEYIDMLIRLSLLDNMKKHLSDCIEITEQKTPYGMTRYTGFLRVYKQEAE